MAVLHNLKELLINKIFKSTAKRNYGKRFACLDLLRNKGLLKAYRQKKIAYISSGQKKIWGKALE